MRKTTGKVVEVFIPDEYKEGVLLNVMDRRLIGFKIATSKEIKEVILTQNQENAKIMKDDFVTICDYSAEMLHQTKKFFSKKVTF